MVLRIVGIFLQGRFVKLQGASEALLPTQQIPGRQHERREVRTKAGGLASGLHGLLSLSLFSQRGRAYVESARVFGSAAEDGCAELRRFF